MSRYESPLPFGRVKDQNIQLMEFCPDPDGSVYRWFRSTNLTIPLQGLVQVGEVTRQTNGSCYKVGEFYSPFADMLFDALREAPGNATLAAFKRGGGVGTRTFTEIAIASFYAPATTLTTAQATESLNE
ncbi:MAG: hypothetical protein JWO47_82 [Candidatus Saccharibacteria bacterium]|nr:hypothetical protein [Candidatus Saccharibacteria bacterium]